ncbi:MAG: galactose mutarotase [Ruminococcaceae bacterium]|nr:galactose mutarotase [Oscillospiraceae bacterium]
MSIHKSYFDTMADGREVHAFTITDGDCSVKLLEFGGIVNRLCLPDREGRIANVVCGYGSIRDYLSDNNHHGGLIGRFANRIKDGRFSLNGKEYRLALNEEGVVHLHGGNEGFDRKKWVGEAIGEQSVRFSYVSEDGEEGYPGRLAVQVTYTLEGGRLTIRYQAETDADTVVNLTNHAYFNLNGVGSGTVLDHRLFLDSDAYSVLDEHLVPTGEPQSVEGSRFDFRNERPIGEGYDNNFVLRNRKDTPAATLYSPESGRKLTVYTDMPELQLYTAVMMEGVDFENGEKQLPLQAVCLETQFRPNDPNAEKPASLLRKGERYDRTTAFAFSLQ